MSWTGNCQDGEGVARMTVPPFVTDGPVGQKRYQMTGRAASTLLPRVSCRQTKQYLIVLEPQGAGVLKSHILPRLVSSRLLFKVVWIIALDVHHLIAGLLEGFRTEVAHQLPSRLRKSACAKNGAPLVYIPPEM